MSMIRKSRHLVVALLAKADELELDTNIQNTPVQAELRTAAAIYQSVNRAAERGERWTWDEQVVRRMFDWAARAALGGGMAPLPHRPEDVLDYTAQARTTWLTKNGK